MSNVSVKVLGALTSIFKAQKLGNSHFLVKNQEICILTFDWDGRRVFLLRLVFIPNRYRQQRIYIIYPFRVYCVDKL